MPFSKKRTRKRKEDEGGVQVWFRVQFQVVKVPIFAGPIYKATASKLFEGGIPLSEYGSEGFRVQLRRLSGYVSVAYLVERGNAVNGEIVL